MGGETLNLDRVGLISLGHFGISRWAMNNKPFALWRVDRLGPKVSGAIFEFINRYKCCNNLNNRTIEVQSQYVTRLFQSFAR